MIVCYVTTHHSDVMGVRESSMLFVRPLLVSLLCSLILLGHAPAWLHVGGCSHALESSVDPKPFKAVACSHSCDHHTESNSQGQAAENGCHESKVPDGHEHDSDSCVICQSLVAPTGMQWEQGITTVGDLGHYQSSRIAASRAIPAQHRIPHPRGPPSLIS